jgi:hypothetical protein
VPEEKSPETEKVKKERRTRRQIKKWQETRNKFCKMFHPLWN